jgi:hypothetical protein
LAWFSGNLLKLKPDLEDAIAMPYLEALKPLLYFNYNTDTVEEMIWAVNYFLDNDNPKTDFIFNIKIIPRLKQCFIVSHMSFILPITRIFGKLVMGSSTVIKSFLDSEFKESLLEKTKSIHPILAMDALWMLSNLILSGSKVMMFFNEPNTLDLMRSIIFNDKGSITVKREALKVLNNFMRQYGLADKEDYLFKFGYLDCIFHLMETMDRQSLDNGLDYIEEILKFGISSTSSK